MNGYLFTVLIWLLSLQLYAQHEDFNIKEYGAVPDGKTLGTIAIQRAIDACAENGGGRVLVPAGIFLTGTLKLKSNVDFHLGAGSILIGSKDREDYPLIEGERGLIFGNNIENVSITGIGEINGNGRAFFKGDNAPDRPFLVMFKHSRHINVNDVTLKNSAFWTFRLLYSDGIIVNGIRIYAHVNFNNDGIDIDSKNVVISNCLIDTDDDALCFKSDSTFVCENVSVTNCVLASNCNFIKMGTASFGGFKNISVTNCTMRKASESNFRFWNKTIKGVKDEITGLAGIALEIVDGGEMDQVNISNIMMQGVQTPIFIRLGTRQNPTGSLKNINISNVIAHTYSKIPSSITAVPGFFVENVNLRDIFIYTQGGATNTDIETNVPEQAKEYPENRMFGPVLPAHGIFARHVKNLSLDNVHLNLLSPDARPAIYMEDVTGVAIKNLKADAPVGYQPVVRFNKVINAFISGYSPDATVALFLDLKGKQTENILLSNSNLYHVKDVYTKDQTIKNNIFKFSL